MANSLGDLIVKIGADISDYVNQLGKAQKQIAALGSQLETVGARMSVAITAPMVGLGVAALKTAGQFEQNQIAFKTMLGSAESAKGMLQELSALAASSPFELQDTVTGARRLLAMGTAAKDVVPTMRTIGNAVSALGSGSQGLERVSVALGQMGAKGKATGEEMRQLTEAGIKGWDYLAKAIGTTVPEAMKQSEKGLISSKVAIKAILEGIEKDFAGAMEAQNKTFLGQMSNLKDNITRTLGQIGEVLMPTAKAVVEMMQPMLAQAVELARAFAALPTPVQQAAIGLVGLVAAVGPLVFITGALASSVGSVVKAFQLLKAAGAIASTFTAITASTGPLLIALAAVTTAVVLMGVEFNKTFAALDKVNKDGWDAYLDRLKHCAMSLPEVKAEQEKVNAAQRAGTITAQEAAQATKVLNDRLSGIGANNAEATYKGIGLGLEVVTKKTETLTAVEEIAAKKHKAFSEATLRAQLERVAALEAEGNHAAIAARKLAAFYEQMINGGDAIQDLADGLTLTVPKVIDVAEAFKTLRVISLEELQKTEEKAVASFEAIKQSGTSSWLKITEAAIEAAKAQVATAAAMGKDVSAELATIAAAQAQVDAANGKMATSTATASQKMSKSMQVVSTAVTDLSRGIADAIVHAKNLGDVFKKVAESMAEAVIRLLIEGALAKLGDKLIKLGGMWGKLGGAIGGGGGQGSSAPSIPGIGGGGGAGSAVGAAAGAGVTGIVGAVAGVVSAVSGIIGNFQMRAMNKSLDLIEANTRFTQIGIIGPGGMLDRLNTYLPGLVGVQDRLVDVRGALFSPVASTLEGIYDRLGGGGKGGAGGSMTMNFYGVTDPRQMAEKIVASMKLAGVKV